MELFLIRHAIAEPYSSERPDEQRQLTPKGRARFRRCVAGLARMDIGFERLLHSPLVRAVQTAQELLPLLDGESMVTPLLANAPSDALLQELEGVGSAALVGHEPWMSDLMNLLLCEGGALSQVAFKKGALAWLRGDPLPGAMELRAFLPPRVMLELDGE